MGLLAGLTPFLSGAEVAAGAAAIAGAAALLASAVLLSSALWPDNVRRVVQRALDLAAGVGLDRERWMGVLEGVLDGLSPLRSGRRGLSLLVWSAATWAGVVAFYWFVMRAFLPNPPALAAPFLVCIAALGMAVPASPGAVGVFQAAIRFGLTEAFDVPAVQAITVAFGIHTVQYILGCLLGLIGLGQESLSLSWLRARVSTTEGMEGG